jgi:hypothetical protein
MSPELEGDDVTTEYHESNSEGIAFFNRTQDVEPILDEVARIKQVSNGMSKSGELAHVGRIPAVIVEKYCTETGITFAEFLQDKTHIQRIVSDPNYSRFRIWEGSIH